MKREANDRYWKEQLAPRHTRSSSRTPARAANSYYFDRHGDVPFRAATSLETSWRSARFNLDDYRFATAAG